MNNILMLFIFVPILALILLFLNLLLAPHAPYEAKVSGYECGYQSIPGQTRSTFQIQFFLVALLFLVFDGAGADAAAAEGPKGAPIATIITSSHSFLISTLTLSILLFVLKPSILLNSTQLLSLSLFYY